MDDNTASLRVEESKAEEGPVLRDSAYADGTFHQSQLAPDAVKQGLFDKPDATLADAVHKDADAVEFTDAEEVGQLSFTSLRLVGTFPARKPRTPSLSFPLARPPRIMYDGLR